MTDENTYPAAKRIAEYFHDVKCKDKYTSAIFSRTIVTAQTLLKSKYTEEEITCVVDYVFDVMKVDVYSFGYINSCINNILREINKQKHKEEMKLVKKEIAVAFSSPKEEVKSDEQAGERNRDKLRRLGSKPGFRKEPNLDLFERQ